MALITTLDTSYYVYVLFDENGRVFYIGKGKGRRWLWHEAHLSRKTLKNRTIRRVIDALGELPKVKIAEEITHDQAIKTEIALIAAIGRRPTGPLLNITSGGEGCGYSPSKSTRRKRSRSLKGRVINQATRDAVALANSKRVMTGERKKKISDGVKRSKPWTRWSPEARKKIIGRLTDPAVVAKRLAASTGRKWEPDERQRRIKAMRSARMVRAAKKRAMAVPVLQLELFASSAIQPPDSDD